MPFYEKVGTPKITIGLSNYIKVVIIFGLPFVIVSICIPDFDTITVHKEKSKDTWYLEIKTHRNTYTKSL